jgi:alpha-D-glucose phosphate-specific phosphoglucomutase
MVQFGTSGWRGIIGRELTFRRVRMVVQAILETLREEEKPVERIVIGFDTRMLSEKFAVTTAQLLASNGVLAELTPRDVPSPVVASMAIERDAAAGITFTGSHNPPEYNGLKIYTADGILAPEEFTDRVERRFDQLETDYDDTFLPRPDLISEHDPKPAYLARLQGLIDWQAIRDSGIKLIVDPLFGSAREYLDHILLENEVEVDVIHNTRDPYFGGYAPDCTSENLSPLRDLMRRAGGDLGLSTDGDGDRFGILDQGARMVGSSTALAVILDYLARRRNLKGGVGYTVATSGLINATARHHKLELVETAVGFKNFGPLLVDGTLEYAGEESAGLAWSKHLPERDGVLACLLAAEMVAVEGKSMNELANDLGNRVGTFSFRRTQIALTERTRDLYEDRLKQKWTDVNGFKVVDVDRRDGLKLIFEGGSWILVRIAGTEPKIRLYVEGRSSEERRHLMHIVRQFFSQRRL